MSRELTNVEMLGEWYGQCRTCKHWDGNRKRSGWWGECIESEITGMTDTTHCGYCSFWESFDEEAAERVRNLPKTG